ncbi:MAG: hypothetical protein R3B06_25315 [Kofleriaceae bacterium]
MRVRVFALVLLATGTGTAGADDGGHATVTFMATMDRAGACPAAAATTAAARAWRGELGDAPRLPVAPRLTVAGGRASGFAWQTELTAGWIPGRTAAHQRAAEAEADAVGADGVARRRRCQLDASTAWLAVVVVDEQLTLADRERAEAAELVELARRGLAAAVATRAEVAAATAYQQEVELRHLELEGALLDAELMLGEALGVGAALFAGGPWPTVADVGSIDDPTIAARRSQAAAALARATAARRAGRPQVDLGVRVEGDAAGTTVLGLAGIGLAAGDRGALDAAAARAAARLAEADVDALAAALARDDIRTHHEIEHADERVAVQAARVAALREQVAALTAGRSAGESLVTELVVARRALTGAEIDQVAARGEAARARIERAVRAGWEGQ